MTVKDRLKEFAKLSGLTNQQFEIEAGLSNGYIANIRDSVGKRGIERISNRFPELNIGWLLTGEGEMFKEEAPNQEQWLNVAREAVMNSDVNSINPGKMIPFFDSQAAAGNSYEMDMSAVTIPSKMIRMGDFLSDSEAAIQIFGNSMLPNYPPGCIVGTKLHTDSFIEPGTVYVIETRDNRYLKRLYYCEGEDCFECVSDNHILSEEGSRKGKPCYPSFKVPFNEVIRLHRVTGVIKRNII